MIMFSFTGSLCCLLKNIIHSLNVCLIFVVAIMDMFWPVVVCVLVWDILALFSRNLQCWSPSIVWSCSVGNAYNHYGMIVVLVECYLTNHFETCDITWGLTNSVNLLLIATCLSIFSMTVLLLPPGLIQLESGV